MYLSCVCLGSTNNPGAAAPSGSVQTAKDGQEEWVEDLMGERVRKSDLAKQRAGGAAAAVASGAAGRRRRPPRGSNHREKDAEEQEVVDGARRRLPGAFEVVTPDTLVEGGGGDRYGGSGGVRPALTAQSTSPDLAEVKRLREHVITHRSNQQLVRNALTFVCMAGPRHPERERLLQLIEGEYSGYNFLILLGRGNGQQFKAMYVCNHDGSGSRKIHGTGPTNLADDMVETVYKYDSGHKEFRAMSGTQKIGNTAVGVVLQQQFYRKASNAWAL